MVADIFSPVFIKRYMYVAIESRVTFETMEIVCLQTLFPSAIIAKDDLLSMANTLAMLEVQCMKACRPIRTQQKELIMSKLGYKTRTSFTRDRVIYKTIKEEFVRTLMNTTKTNGSGTYKKRSAEEYWRHFMNLCYGAQNTNNKELALEELSDEER